MFEERKGNVYVLAIKNCIRLNIPVRPENISRKKNEQVRNSQTKHDLKEVEHWHPQ